MRNIDEIQSLFFYGEKIVSEEKRERIEEFIDEMGLANSQPQIATKIVELTNDSNASFSELEKIINSDPVIVGKILKMANSSFYNLRREVSSMRRAILVLGTTMVRDIALSIAILDMFNTKNRSVSLAIWEHSVATSIAAKMITNRFSYHLDTEACFTSGLMHDLGKMILGKDPRYMTIMQTLSQHGPEEALIQEEETFGFNHSELGYVLADKWNFSEEIKYTINNHHNVNEIIHTDSDLNTTPSKYIWNLAIVAAANRASHYIGAGSERLAEDIIPENVVQFLGFKDKNDFIETFIPEFKETYIREKNIFA